MGIALLFGGMPHAVYVLVIITCGQIARGGYGEGGGKEWGG